MFKKWFKEREEQKQLEKQMDEALTDPTLLSRITIDSAKQRIANKESKIVADGLRRLRRIEKMLNAHTNY